MTDKRASYILIFTCMNTRYIHLELVNSLCIDDFILAFVRFYNRFSFPAVLYLDNAKTFASGSVILSDLIGSDTFQKKFQHFNLRHNPIPAFSLWFGACMKRLIKTVKQCFFYKSVGRVSLSIPQFLTVLSDIQVAINN